MLQAKGIEERIVSVGSFLDLYNEKFGAKPFFRKKVTDGFWERTYSGFREDCYRFAAGLIKNGLESSHIAIVCENRYEYLVSYLGTMMSGNTFIPVNYDLEPDKRIGMMNFSDADALIISDEYIPQIEDYKSGCPKIKTYIGMDSANGFDLSFDGIIASVTAEDAYSRDYPLDSIHNDHTAILSFTSGTSGGLPKAVMLTIANILAAPRYRVVELYDFTNNLYLMPLPMFHLAALNFIFYVMMPDGAALCISYTMKDIFRDMPTYKTEWIMTVPALATVILQMLEGEVDRLGKREEFEAFCKKCEDENIPILERHEYCKQFKAPVGGNLIIIAVVGAKSPDELKTGLFRFGIHVRDCYGMTECSPQIASEFAEYRLGTVGQVAPFNTVKIVDGVAYVKGDNVMKGYYKNPQGTREILTEDGWLSTGDLARLDDDGFMYILGRAKNVIALANGENVDAEEIEALIIKSKFVSEVLVVQDQKSANNTLGAMLYLNDAAVKQDGRDAADIVAAEIKAVNKSLPLYKRIGRTRIMDAPFEKNSMMKILRLKYPHIDA